MESDNSLFECPVCLCHYDLCDHSPKMLPDCGHTLCSKCLSILLKNKNTSKCPTDNKAFSNHLNKIEFFPSNFTLRQIIEERMKARVCPDHKVKLNLMCLSDKRKICHECALLGNHQGHKIISFEEQAKKALEQAAKLESTLNNLTNHYTCLYSAIKDRKALITNHVENFFKNLRAALTQKENDCLLKIKNFFDSENTRVERSQSNSKDEIIKKVQEIKNNAQNEFFLLHMAENISSSFGKYNLNLWSEQLKKEAENFVLKLANFDEFALNQAQEIKKMKFDLDQIFDRMDLKIVADKNIGDCLNKIQIVPISTGILQDIHKGNIDKFKVVFFETRHDTTLKSLKAELIKHCNSLATDWFEAKYKDFFSPPFPIIKIKLWRLDRGVELAEVLENIMNAAKASSTFNYKLGFKGRLLKDNKRSIEEANIAESDYLFLEPKNSWGSWHFVGED